MEPENNQFQDERALQVESQGITPFDSTKRRTSKEAPLVITYSFEPRSIRAANKEVDALYENLGTLQKEEREVVLTLFADLERICDVRFEKLESEKSDKADIAFFEAAGKKDSDFIGHSFPAGEDRKDIFIRTDYIKFGEEFRKQVHDTIAHELGHAMGLPHTNNNRRAENFDVSTTRMNDNPSSVPSEGFRYWDVEALRKLYGPSREKSGDNYYTLQEIASRTLVDTDGHDTLSLARDMDFDQAIIDNRPAESLVFTCR
jgi:hypothetical protein